MNSKKRIMGKNVLLGLIAVLIIISVITAIRGGEWRPVWDFLWGWINFLFLFTAIYWWGWPFFMKLLNGRIKDIADEISQMETENANIAAEISNIEGQLAKSAERFEEIKIKLEKEIGQKREQIIAKAKKEAAALLEQAGEQRKSIISEAKKDLKAELVDLAINNALTKLPGIINEKDQQHLFEKFYTGAFKNPQAA